MANHALPTTSSTYTNFVLELNARIDDAVKWGSSTNTTPTNPPTFMTRWNNANSNWEYNSGTPAAPVWSILASNYSININGTVGAVTPNTGSFTTLTASGIATLGASSVVGGSLIATAANTLTLTNKTLTAPVISSIVNTGTLTLPTVTDTLVGRLTTDTLTNKTLTDPKFTSAAALKDANNVNLILFPTAVTSAVNYFTVSNTVTGVAPNISATGTDVNISLNLVPKGTGVVQINGIEVVGLSSTQTLTNKTLTTPVITSISNGGTVTVPAGTDTLATLTAAQTITNKSFTTGNSFNGSIGATTASTGAFTTLSATSTVSGTGITALMASPGPIGSTTASTGAFTTLSATSTVSGTGITALMAAPGPIGSTTASTGAFTTLSATSTVSGTGFSTYLASPPAIGSTVASTGAFTTLSATSTVSGAGITALMASPGPIGSTTASTGAFTTLGFTTSMASSAGYIVLGNTSSTAPALIDLQSTTKGLKFPVMTSAQKTAITGVAGLVVFDSDLSKLSAYSGAAWGSVGGGATGGSTDDIFYENGQTITANYTITTNKNAMSAGPITINTGITVTVPTGATWSVI